MKKTAVTWDPNLPKDGNLLVSEMGRLAQMALNLKKYIDDGYRDAQGFELLKSLALAENIVDMWRIMEDALNLRTKSTQEKLQTLHNTYQKFPSLRRLHELRDALVHTRPYRNDRQLHYMPDTALATVIDRHDHWHAISSSIEGHTQGSTKQILLEQAEKNTVLQTNIEQLSLEKATSEALLNTTDMAYAYLHIALHKNLTQLLDVLKYDKTKDMEGFMPDIRYIDEITHATVRKVIGAPTHPDPLESSEPKSKSKNAPDYAAHLANLVMRKFTLPMALVYAHQRQSIKFPNTLQQSPYNTNAANIVPTSTPVLLKNYAALHEAMHRQLMSNDAAPLLISCHPKTPANQQKKFSICTLAIQDALNCMHNGESKSLTGVIYPLASLGLTVDTFKKVFINNNPTLATAQQQAAFVLTAPNPEHSVYRLQQYFNLPKDSVDVPIQGRVEFSEKTSTAVLKGAAQTAAITQQLPLMAADLQSLQVRNTLFQQLFQRNWPGTPTAQIQAMQVMNSSGLRR